MSKQQATEIINEVTHIFAVYLEKEFKGNPYEINWKCNTKEYSKGDQEKFGHVLMDVHFFFKVEIDYEPYTEFATFPTLEDACNHVVDKVLVKKGFNPKTLKPIR